MNEAALQTLRLDARAVERKVTFYRAYALTCERESRGSIERIEPGERALSNSTRDDRLLEAASSLRKAAGWALLTDERVGVELLERSARIYMRLGFGFGLFLAAATGRREQEPERQQESRRLLNAIDALQAGAQRSVDDRQRNSDVDVPDPMRHPQQQAYAAVAAAVTEDLRPVVSRIWEESSQRLGVLPVGALGTPIRRFWAVTQGLLQGDLEITLAHLGAMSQRFSDNAESAMSNTQMWRNAHAEFEAVDLDIVGLTVLACRRFGDSTVVSIAEQKGTFGFGLGLSQLGVATSLLSAGGGV